MAINFFCRTGARTPSCDRAWPDLCSRRFRLTAKQKGGRSLCRPASLERTTYFRLVIAVRSAENFTTPVAPHQLEPKAAAPLPGLIAVTKDGLKLVVL